MDLLGSGTNLLYSPYALTSGVQVQDSNKIF